MLLGLSALLWSKRASSSREVRMANGHYAVFEIHLDTCPSPPCCLCLSVGLFISVFLTLSIIR